jgi:DNA-binding MarR family transcriptional regulator/GNAT superfamily N-acetyltransferase
MPAALASLPSAGPLSSQVGAVRRFNRFYTRAIGVLGEGYLAKDLSLTEGRVIYELAQAGSTSATAICQMLKLDAGYLSRVLKRFEARGLIERRAASDRRSSTLSLTPAGRSLYDMLDRRSDEDVSSLIAPLPASERERLAAAMRDIEAVLAGPSDAPITLRSHRSGDMGWIVERHGILYRQEFGWNERFEGLVAEIVSQFIARYDPAVERCWIAEQAGRRVGCVFVERGEVEGIAKLRLLLVEPSVRGHGLGHRLVRQCVDFAGEKGYRRLKLWTQENLIAARKIYAAAGFRMTHSEPHENFGHSLVSEYWERDLEGDA